jgi:hypothetical protein
MGKLSKEEKRERLKKRQEERGVKAGFTRHLLDLSGYDEVKFYQLKKGKNFIDILPYEVSTNRHPEGIPAGEDDYKLEIWQHTNIGVNEDRVLCLKKTYGKKCPICEERQSMLDSGKDWKDESVKALAPKIRCYYNVIDISEESETDNIQIFETSGASEWFEDLLSTESKEGGEIVPFYDLEEGKTVVCRCKEDTFNKKKFAKPERIDFEDRDEYPDKTYEEVFPLEALLIVPTYDEVTKLFLGLDEDKPEESTESKPVRKSKKTEPEETEPEPKPKKGRRKAAPEPDPEPKEDEAPTAGDCPFGHIFGAEFKKHESCEECDDDKFEQCGDKFDAMKTPETKKRRRR